MNFDEEKSINNEDTTNDNTEETAKELNNQNGITAAQDDYSNVQIKYYEKKKIKHLPLLVISGSVLLLFAVFSVIWLFFMVDAKILISGKKNFLIGLETSEIKKLSSNQQTKSGNANTNPDLKYRLSSKISGSLKNVPENDMQLAMLDEMLKTASIDIKLEEDSAAKKSKVEIKGSLSSLLNISLEGVANENQIAVRMPQANDEYILTDMSKYKYSDIDSVLKEFTGKSQSEFTDIIQGYFDDVLINSITDNDISYNRKDTVQDVSCNSMTISLTAEAYSKMLNIFADKLENDNDLLDMAQFISDKANNDSLIEMQERKTAIPSKDDIKAEISNIANSLREYSKNLSADSFTYKVWFDDNEKIIAREINNSQIKIYVFSNQTEETNKFIMNMEEKAGENGFLNIAFDGKGKTSVLDFTFSINCGDKNLKDKFKLLWTNKLEDRMNGSIAVDYSDGQKPMGSALLEYSNELDLSSIAFPFIGTYNLEVKDAGGKSIFKMNSVTEEITENSEFKTRIEISNGLTLLNPAYTDVTVNLTAITKYEELQSVDIPEISALKTVKIEDVDFNKYFEDLMSLFNSISTIQ